MVTEGESKYSTDKVGIVCIYIYGYFFYIEKITIFFVPPNMIGNLIHDNYITLKKETDKCHIPLTVIRNELQYNAWQHKENYHANT